MTRTQTLDRCHVLPSMPVSFGSEAWSYICGCDWRTPVVSDKTTAWQALQAHKEKR